MLIGLGLKSGLGLVMHYPTPKAKVLGKPFQFFCLTLMSIFGISYSVLLLFPSTLSSISPGHLLALDWTGESP